MKKQGLTVEEALADSTGLAVLGVLYTISNTDNQYMTPLVDELQNIINSGKFAYIFNFIFLY